MERYWANEVESAKAKERQSEIVRLFRAAQLKEPAYTTFRPAPGGYTSHWATVFDNIFLRHRDVQAGVSQSFAEAKGYFRDEIRRSFIPVFWPSVLINLPADALVYAGLSPEATGVRVAKLVSAAAGLAGGAVTVWRVLA